MEENISTSPNSEAIGQLTDEVAELKAKSVSGFGWSTIQQIVGRVTTFVVNLALARLLVPEDFGTIAVLGIFLAISSQLADVGFSSSLMRSEKVDDADLSTIFYYNIAMSSLLYLVLFVTAPWVADYFHNPILCSVLRVQSLSVVINSLCSIQAILVWRQMHFRKDMIVQLTIGVISGLTGILMAYLGYGYWALVGMGLAGSLSRFIGYWFSSPWRPKLVFSIEKLKIHFGYGSRIVGSGMISTLYNNLMTILIGRYFSLTTLGLYGNASALYLVPVSVLADPINKVTFPVLVRFQNNEERLRAGYRRVMRLLFQLSCPVMVTLVVLANPFYHLLYGDKWMAAAPYFQILCICGILFPINSYNINLLEVKGRSDLHLRLEIFRRVIGVVAAFIGLQFGIYGLLWSAAITQVIHLFINSHYSGHFIDFPLKQQLGELFPFALMSAVAGGVLWGLDYYALSALADFWRLAIGTSILGLTYLLLVYLFAREDFRYVWGLVRHYVCRDNI